MMGIRMLVEAVMGSLGIDAAQAQALFERVQKEAPEILEFIRAKVGEIDSRLAGIEQAQKEIHLRLLSIGIPSYGPPEAKGGPVNQDIPDRHPGEEGYPNGRG